jgi:DNA-binding transcriptional MerR regulator
MGALAERPDLRLLTIGEVRRLVGRSATAIRRMEGRGVVTPLRTTGQDRRLYTVADVEAIRKAIRDTASVGRITDREPLPAA